MKQLPFFFSVVLSAIFSLGAVKTKHYSFYIPLTPSDVECINKILPLVDEKLGLHAQKYPHGVVPIKNGYLINQVKYYACRKIIVSEYQCLFNYYQMLESDAVRRAQDPLSGFKSATAQKFLKPGIVCGGLSLGSGLLSGLLFYTSSLVGSDVLLFLGCGSTVGTTFLGFLSVNALLFGTIQACSFGRQLSDQDKMAYAQYFQALKTIAQKFDLVVEGNSIAYQSIQDV